MLAADAVVPAEALGALPASGVMTNDLEVGVPVTVPATALVGTRLRPTEQLKPSGPWRKRSKGPVGDRRSHTMMKGPGGETNKEIST